jgi:predicted small lipoprotein YifL
MASNHHRMCLLLLTMLVSIGCGGQQSAMMPPSIPAPADQQPTETEPQKIETEPRKVQPEEQEEMPAEPLGPDGRQMQ